MSISTPPRGSQRIVVHSPSGEETNLISRVLQQNGVDVAAFPALSDFCAAIRSEAGAAVVASEVLSPEALRLVEDVLRQQPAWSDLPFIVLTAADLSSSHLTGPDSFDSLGNVSLIERPLRRVTLMSAVRFALRARLRQYDLSRELLARERVAADLRSSEERYRTLAESLPQLVWTCLPDGTCDYLSSQWVAYTGIPAEDQLGLKWLDLVMHPDDRARTHEAWMTAVADLAPYDLDYRLRRYDGVYRWFKTRGTPVRDAAGKILKWFGTCTDAEEEIRSNQERLGFLIREQSARRTAEILNLIGPMLISELDTERLTQKVTDLATELTGARYGAFFHNAVDERGEHYLLYTLSGVPREEFAHFPVPRNTAVFGSTFRGEGVLRSGDITKDPRYGNNPPYQGIPEGHLPVRSYLAASVVSRSGEVLGGLFFGHPDTDIFTEEHERMMAGVAAQAAFALDNARLFDEQQKARNVLQRVNTELRRVNDDLNQFAYSASHDLQEPLRMVAIYSQLMQRNYRGRLDDQADQYLAFMVAGAQRMSQLVKDLLSYTQAVNVVPEEGRSPVSAHDILKNALHNLRGPLETSGAHVEIGPLPVVLVKETHLLQLFQNVIGNSLKYRSADPPYISVSAKREGNMYRFSIQDNGIGVEAEYTDQVFGLFKRLHTSEKYEGTGIGLAICHRIVERYNGRIWVTSDGPGRGATFCFTLPAVNADA